MIYCGLCKKAHEPVFPGAQTQGDGCAAEVQDGLITGHYGSYVADLQTYRMLTTPPENGTLVCDSCLKTMIEKNEIVLQSDHPSSLS